MVKIKEEVIRDILYFSKNTYPKEFIGLLEGYNGVITKIVVLPGEIYGFGFSSINKYMLPLGMSIIGSVHSHPSGNATPSNADLLEFQKTGKYHIIVGYPYDIKSVRVYNSKGQEIDFEIQ